jgi:hypothetical protein
MRDLVRIGAAALETVSLLPGSPDRRTAKWNVFPVDRNDAFL